MGATAISKKNSLLVVDCMNEYWKVALLVGLLQKVEDTAIYSLGLITCTSKMQCLAVGIASCAYDLLERACFPCHSGA